MELVSVSPIDCCEHFLSFSSVKCLRRRKCWRERGLISAVVLSTPTPATQCQGRAAPVLLQGTSQVRKYFLWERFAECVLQYRVACRCSSAQRSLAAICNLRKVPRIIFCGDTYKKGTSATWERGPTRAAGKTMCRESRRGDDAAGTRQRRAGRRAMHRATAW